MPAVSASVYVMSDNTATSVKPSATPTDAEIEAWNRLPREEQLRLLREEVDHPDCKRVTAATMEAIRLEGQALVAKLRNG